MCSLQRQVHSAQEVGKKVDFGWRQGERVHERRRASEVQVWKHQMLFSLASMADWSAEGGWRSDDRIKQSDQVLICFPTVPRRVRDRDQSQNPNPTWDWKGMFEEWRYVGGCGEQRFGSSAGSLG